MSQYVLLPKHKVFADMLHIPVAQYQGMLLAKWDSLPQVLKEQLAPTLMPTADSAVSKTNVQPSYVSGLATLVAKLRAAPAAEPLTGDRAIDSSVAGIAGDTVVKALERFTKEHTQLAEDVRGLREQLSQKLTMLERINVRMAELTQAMPDHNEKGQRLVEGLGNIDGVRSVVYKDGGLEVLTEPLIATGVGTNNKYAIGSYKINIATNGSIMVTAADALSQAYKAVCGHAGPHVGGDGHPCLGTLAGVLPDLIGQQAWAEVVSLSIEFMRSVNETDVWGKYSYLFPMVAQGSSITKWQEDVDGKAAQMVAVPTPTRRASAASATAENF